MFQGLLLKWMLILSCLAFMIVVGENDKTMELPSLYDSRSPLGFAVVHDLPLPASLHLSKHVLSQGAPIEALSPVSPPSYGPFSSNGQSPTSSRLTIPFRMKSEMKPPISGFKYIAPVHSAAAAGPSASTQPPLSPYASSMSSLFLLIDRYFFFFFLFYNIFFLIFFFLFFQSEPTLKYLACPFIAN